MSRLYNELMNLNRDLIKARQVVVSSPEEREKLDDEIANIEDAIFDKEQEIEDEESGKYNEFDDE